MYKAEVRRSFITSTTTVRDQSHRSHHKGATGSRVRTGDERSRYPALWNCQLGQDIPVSLSSIQFLTKATWNHLKHTAWVSHFWLKSTHKSELNIMILCKLCVIDPDSHHEMCLYRAIAVKCVRKDYMAVHMVLVSTSSVRKSSVLDRALYATSLSFETIGWMSSTFSWGSSEDSLQTIQGWRSNHFMCDGLLYYPLYLSVSSGTWLEKPQEGIHETDEVGRQTKAVPHWQGTIQDFQQSRLYLGYPISDKGSTGPTHLCL